MPFFWSDFETETQLISFFDLVNIPKKQVVLLNEIWHFPEYRARRAF